MDYARRVSSMARRVPLLPEILFWYYCYVRTAFEPPQLFNYVGFPDFSAIGKGHFDNIVRLGGVKPSDRVVDVGCGIGRVAIHFTTFLDASGSYEGFDVVKMGPAWCNQKIAKRDSRFSFRHVDVYNVHYNSRGTIRAGEFVFPYDDASVDFVFATSVFTHMLPHDVRRYLKEINRVLRPGGCTYISYFVLNDVSKSHMNASDFPFRCVDPRYGVLRQDDPEAAIAYEESFLAAAYDEAGLRMNWPILYGDWSGRDAPIGGQDAIVAEKPA